MNTKPKQTAMPNAEDRRAVASFAAAVAKLQDPCPELIASSLQSVARNIAAFSRCAPTAGAHPYNKLVLSRTAHLELVLLGWAPGAECAPHDHGTSAGAIVVCAGTLCNTVYRLEEGRLTKSSTERAVGSGVLLLAPDTIHAMADTSADETLVTLHIYWPPIAQMNVFDLRSRQVYAVDDDAGAWLPVAEEHLRSVTQL